MENEKLIIENDLCFKNFFFGSRHSELDSESARWKIYCKLKIFVSFYSAFPNKMLGIL